MTPASPEPFDLVVRGGGVLDPSTGLDAGLDLGVCDGRIADIAVFDVASGERRNRDPYGGSRTGSVTIGARQTIRTGIPWFAPLPHPGRSVAVRPD